MGFKRGGGILMDLPELDPMEENEFPNLKNEGEEMGTCWAEAI